MPSRYLRTVFYPVHADQKSRASAGSPLHLGLHVDHNGTRYVSILQTRCTFRRVSAAVLCTCTGNRMPFLIKAGIILGNVGVAPVPSAPPDSSGRSGLRSACSVSFCRPHAPPWTGGLTEPFGSGPDSRSSTRGRPLAASRGHQTDTTALRTDLIFTLCSQNQSVCDDRGTPAGGGLHDKQQSGWPPALGCRSQGRGGEEEEGGWLSAAQVRELARSAVPSAICASMGVPVCLPACLAVYLSHRVHVGSSQLGFIRPV